MKSRSWLSILFASLLAQSAAADLMTYRCSGVVIEPGSVPGSQGANVTWGEPFTLTLTMETDTPNSPANTTATSTLYFGAVVQVLAEFGQGRIDSILSSQTIVTDNGNGSSTPTASIDAFRVLMHDGANFDLSLRLTDWSTNGVSSTLTDMDILQNFSILDFSEGGLVKLTSPGTFYAPNRIEGLVQEIEIVEPFENFCFGSGGQVAGCTPCPCGNAAAADTRGGCLNQEGRSARLFGSGFASITDDDLWFSLEGASSNTFALLFSAAAIAPTNPANPCFGLNSGVTSPTVDGLRCAVQDVRRHGIRATDSSGTTLQPFGSPTNSILEGQGFTAGQNRAFQCFYRTAITSGCQTGQNSSQAVLVEILP